MPTADEVVAQARHWLGKQYLFGAEQGDCTPRDTDCSELVEAACRCLNLSPKMPDGSGNQFAHCDSHGGRVTFEQASVTVGALLFKSYDDSYPPGDRNEGGIYHVAVVAGTDRTVEACCDDGDKIVERSISGRSWYVWGGLIPGVQYSTPEPPPGPSRRRNKMPVFVRRPDGAVYMFELSGKRFGIASPTDHNELVRAVKEPGYTANVSQKTFDQIAQACPVN